MWERGWAGGWAGGWVDGWVGEREGDLGCGAGVKQPKAESAKGEPKIIRIWALSGI